MKEKKFSAFTNEKGKIIKRRKSDKMGIYCDRRGKKEGKKDEK
jgi:hypothetical protein